MTVARKYKAIIFDVGGTLLDVFQNPQELAINAISHLGTASVPAYSAALLQVADGWRRSGGPPEVEDLPATWVKHHRRALEIAGFTGDLDVAAQILEDTFLTEGWTVFPDVPGVLRRLADTGYPLGIISNWPATLESTLQRSGLFPHFQVIVGSGNVGYAKPHPQIFRIAAERMAIRPEEALYVGDSVTHDVGGARSAGMDVILLDREDRCHAETPRIRTLEELPLLLEG